jgi:hypothetical protein
MGWGIRARSAQLRDSTPAASKPSRCSAQGVGVAVMELARRCACLVSATGCAQGVSSRQSHTPALSDGVSCCWGARRCCCCSAGLAFWSSPTSSPSSVFSADSRMSRCRLLPCGLLRERLELQRGGSRYR